jgi:uncharacterized protein (TIGR02186 family)
MSARGRKMAAAMLALLLAWPAAVRADEPLAADLTRHLIAITTGFTGASVVLFGATAGKGEVIVTVRGPERAMTVRRKERFVGIWVNAATVAFDPTPSFYYIAASRPLPGLVDPEVAIANGLGLRNLRFEPESPTPRARVVEFAAAFIRAQQQRKLYPRATAKVHFLGERLFRTTIEFPAAVPTGTYQVETFLVRDHEIAAVKTIPLVVSKTGLGAAVYDFADRRPALYGAIAAAAAMVAGWLVSLPFRGA